MRLIHLTDLPTELVFVYFEEGFRRRFLEVGREVFGTFEKMAEFVEYTGPGITESFRIKNRFTKLSTILKLADFFYKKGYKEFDMNRVEKKIVAYRGIGSSLIIRNPNFPLHEDRRMIRTVFHLLGDGCAGGYGKARPYYRNFTPELLDEFEKDLQVFGGVPFIRRETRVEIPSVVGYILEHIYRIDFGTHKSFIPPVIFSLPKRLIAQGIKAFADDEANMDDSRIRFFSSNKRLLSGVRDLIMEKFPELSGPGKIGKIKKSETSLKGKKFVKYKFPIFSSGLESYHELIGFTHPRKSKSLERFIERRERGWLRRKNGITKLLVIQSLKDRNRTVKEISGEVKTTMHTVRGHLRGSECNGIPSLRKRGLVENVGLTSTRAKIWSITESGFKFLKENQNRLNKFSVKGDSSRFYLDLVRKFSKDKDWVAPSTIAEKIKRRNDTVSKRLLGLYRKNYLKRKRSGKEEYKYRLTKEGIRFLKSANYKDDLSYLSKNKNHNFSTAVRNM